MFSDALPEKLAELFSCSGFCALAFGFGGRAGKAIVRKVIGVGVYAFTVTGVDAGTSAMAFAVTSADSDFVGGLVEAMMREVVGVGVYAFTETGVDAGTSAIAFAVTSADSDFVGGVTGGSCER